MIVLTRYKSAIITTVLDITIKNKQFDIVLQGTNLKSEILTLKNERQHWNFYANES